MTRMDDNFSNMTAEQYVIQILKDEEIEYVATLPCEKIKNLLYLLPYFFKEIKLTREESGIGICSGIYLAGGRSTMVIQSTGLGNSINAIMSLCKTYEIPLPILASWRGIYKEKIPAQIPLGQALPSILTAADIPYKTIDSIDKIYNIKDVIRGAYDNNTPYIALISPKVWEDSRRSDLEASSQQRDKIKERMDIDKINKKEQTIWSKYPEREINVSINYRSQVKKPEMTRYDAISLISDYLNDKPVVSNIGIPSKELYSVKDQPTNFYMLGSLGLASSIGLGVSLFLDRETVSLDGDGSILMNPNALIDVANYQPNLTIFLLDNGVHGSTGDQITSAYNNIDLELVAKSFGIKNTWKVSTERDINLVLDELYGVKGAKLVHIVLKPGNKDVPNIPLDPVTIKERFMDGINNLYAR